ncbi:MULTISPECIES: N-acetylglucosamine-6-phosphate deacetylase [Atlantibacter]|uniref:N-acetylglucosamine-6-phosphate deacetylase n=1 Tax=Atlantibacter TaxID=1903434 RepID=UPI0025874C67|nr:MULTISPECIES: N-acetylglucosamine-6-phosphate deacetylase [Atlantibacter]
MTTKALRSTRIVTPEGLRSGVLTIENGKIAAVVQDYHGEVTDYGDSYLMPGFVDIHVHGWGRGSFAWKGTRESVQAMSRDLVQAGVTSYLATSATMPQAFLERSLQAAAEYIETAPPGDGAEPVGIHMEGPYINKKYLGMQREDSLQPPSVAGFQHFNQLAKGHIRLMTLAPELDGALALIRYLQSQGITASAGHTDATFDEMTAAIDAGLSHVTHAFSAMRGLHHREPGVVGAVMYYRDLYAEVAKQTGITLRPEVFDILYRIKGDRRLVMMSDCLGYVDFPEGYEFHHYLRQETFRISAGKLQISGKDGATRHIAPEDWHDVRQLEMSFLDSIKAVVNRLENGLVSAAQIACLNPAQLAGVAHRKGSLEPGKDADILMLDNDLTLKAVWCRGVAQTLEVD